MSQNTIYTKVTVQCPQDESCRPEVEVPVVLSRPQYDENGHVVCVSLDPAPGALERATLHHFAVAHPEARQPA